MLSVTMKAQRLITFALIAGLLILLLTSLTLASTNSDSSTGSIGVSAVDWVISKVSYFITTITSIIKLIASLVWDLLNVIPVVCAGNKVLVLLTTIARWLRLL